MRVRVALRTNFAMKIPHRELKLERLIEELGGRRYSEKLKQVLDTDEKKRFFLGLRSDQGMNKEDLITRVQKNPFNKFDHFVLRALPICFAQTDMETLQSHCFVLRHFLRQLYVAEMIRHDAQEITHSIEVAIRYLNYCRRRTLDSAIPTAQERKWYADPRRDPFFGHNPESRHSDIRLFEALMERDVPSVFAERAKTYQSCAIKIALDEHERPISSLPRLHDVLITILKSIETAPNPHTGICNFVNHYFGDVTVMVSGRPKNLKFLEYVHHSVSPILGKDADLREIYEHLRRAAVDSMDEDWWIGKTRVEKCEFVKEQVLTYLPDLESLLHHLVKKNKPNLHSFIDSLAESIGWFRLNLLDEFPELRFTRFEYNTLSIRTEHADFRYNFGDAERTGSCVEKGGQEAGEGLLQLLDPYIGFLHLVPLSRDEEHSPIGTAYIVCSYDARTKENLWLVDSVEGGPLLEVVNDASLWKQLVYDGIRAAAHDAHNYFRKEVAGCRRKLKCCSAEERDALEVRIQQCRNKTPQRVLVNARVRNKRPRDFVAYCEEQGRSQGAKVQYYSLIKHGGVDAVAPFFSARGEKPHHYLESWGCNMRGQGLIDPKKDPWDTKTCCDSVVLDREVKAIEIWRHGR